MPDSISVTERKARLNTNEAILRRYPRLCAHIICESLGYATPSMSASILRAVIHGQKHYSEWIDACFAGDPRPAVSHAIQYRRYHRGYLADYPTALRLVQQAVQTGEEPQFASWF